LHGHPRRSDLRVACGDGRILARRARWAMTGEMGEYWRDGLTGGTAMESSRFWSGAELDLYGSYRSRANWLHPTVGLEIYQLIFARAPSRARATTRLSTLSAIIPYPPSAVISLSENSRTRSCDGMLRTPIFWRESPTKT
jgi:hypothetical protein